MLQYENTGDERAPLSSAPVRVDGLSAPDVSGGGASLSGLSYRQQGATDAGIAGFAEGAKPRRKLKGEQEPRRKLKGKLEPKLSDATTASERYALNRYLQYAVTGAKALAESMHKEDQLEVVEAVGTLKGHLRQLWKLRKGREDEWCAILNFLQGALSVVTPEELTSAHAEAILTVIKDQLAMGAVKQYQVEQATETLRRAGLDPWGPLTIRGEG